MADVDKEVEMEEGLGADHGEEAQIDSEDKERLLTEFEAPVVVEKSIRRWLLGLWRMYRSEVWLVANVITTLTTRKLFRGAFPYPLYFTFIVQALSNYVFAVWSIQTLIRGYRETKLKSKEWRFGARAAETVLHSQRLLLSAIFSAAGMLLSAYALAIYPNFHVIALLPVFSYVCDSVLLHIFSILRLHPFQKLPVYLNFFCVILIAACCGVVIGTDYRLDQHAIPFALAGIFLESLSRTLLMLYSNFQEQRQESKSFFIFERFMIGIPQLLVAAVVALRYENTTDIIHRVKSWGFSGWVVVIPAVFMLVVFSSGLNAAYRGPMGEELISVLEDVKPQGKTTLQATLHASYFILAISAFGREYTMFNWFQTTAFASLYVIALGPVHVGYYPLRLHNWIAHLIRRKPRHTTFKSWSLLGYLIACTLLVWSLLSCISIYWINTLAYNHSAKTFLNPSRPHIDYAYRPPRIRGITVLIAHSHNDPHVHLFNMIDRVREMPQIMGLGATIKVYTKDPTLHKATDDQKIQENNIELIPDIGGIAGTYLHYIVNNWASLPTQTLFLATGKDDTFGPDVRRRIRTHFAGQGFPVADAEPKSGFLSLGESQTCACNSCSDSYGWEDTFGLIPSMWTATRPNQTTCDSVLLTYSNNFFASAARLHGVKKDVWETLLRALTREDTQNSWAHDHARLPKMFTGEERKGRWAPEGVYGVLDSKEAPVMGRTMERLWGVLLQCSTAEVAWSCPGLRVGTRVGGRREDCGCIDELAPGFI